MWMILRYDRDLLAVLRGRAAFFIVALVVIVLAILPVYSTRFLPIHDYPFHLARIVILAGLNNSVLARFYEPGSFLLPNLGMDAVAVPLSWLLGPELATRVFVELTLAITLIGVTLLHWAAHRRLSIWPLLTIVILHNGIFRFGFFNYLFGLGLALAAAALWINMKPGVFRLGIALVASIILIYCHLEAFGVFAVIAGGIEIERAYTRYKLVGIWRTLLNLLYSASPFLLCAALFVLFSPTAKVIGQGFGYSPGLGTKPVGGLFSLSSGILWLDALSMACVIAVCVWLFINRYLVISRPLLFASIALSFCFFLVPSSVMGALYADVRLGPAVAILLIATLDLRFDAPKAARISVLALIMTLAVVRSVALTEIWGGYERSIKPIVEAMDRIEPGSTLFAATTQEYPRLIADSPERRAAWQPPLKHVASYAVLHAPIFVPMTWAEPTQQPLIVKPAYQAAYVFQGNNPKKVFNSASLLTLITSIQTNLKNGNWQNMGNVYLLVVDAKRLEPLRLPDSVVRIAEGDRFSLLQFERVR
jgi:hypothetical protein